ncbi:MAG TPA: pyridoxamine 5'-phosphate oxidase family protein [Thermohalobaculum sp.]|nr:pyridoxamine 5'-phosphate oxidase family protein [Thermohalobaculum sp.]
MITDAAQRIIRDFPLGIVATVTPEGRPAASPKGTFLVLDARTLGYGDIRSPGTRANLGHLPEAEVVFVDPFLRKGARIRGRASVAPRGEPRFDALFPRWQAVWGALAERIGALVIFDVTACKPLATPPYDDGATEEEMIALYKGKYAEIYP